MMMSQKQIVLCFKSESLLLLLRHKPSSLVFSFILFHAWLLIQRIWQHFPEVYITLLLKPAAYLNININISMFPILPFTTARFAITNLLTLYPYSSLPPPYSRGAERVYMEGEWMTAQDMRTNLKPPHNNSIQPVACAVFCAENEVKKGVCCWEWEDWVERKKER